MAYDEGLAQRVRETLGNHEGVMACGIVGDRLMVRTGPDAWAEALAQPHAHEMDFTGRSLRGFVYVDSPPLADDGALEQWVRQGVDFAASLPSK